MTHRCMTSLIALALTSPLLAADDPGAPLSGTPVGQSSLWRARLGATRGGSFGCFG